MRRIGLLHHGKRSMLGGRGANWPLLRCTNAEVRERLCVSVQHAPRDNFFYLASDVPQI